MRNPNRNPSTEQSSSSSSSLTNISTTPSNPTERIDDKRIFLSPGFKSVAAMAGWDEEAILLATLVVEDTPERRGGKLEKKKRTEFQFKTPPTNSRRKPKTQKRGSASIPAVVLNLDEEEDTSNSGRVFEKDKKETDANKINSEQQERELDLRARRSSASASSSSTTNNTSVIRPDTDKKELETNEKITKKKQEKDDVQRSSVPSSASSLASTSQSLPEADQKEPKTDKINSKKEDRKEIDDQLDGQRSSAPNPCTSNLPDMDKLREELSCAICLEICFEPSTTTCGHSFCKKCLRSAADKCGKRCPKCRQLIGNGRSCTVNTVLWNTIQLLFPSEIEVRRIASAAAADNNKRGTEQQQKQITERAERGTERRLSLQHRRRHHSSHLPQRAPSNSNNQVVVIPSQNEDAALALRLQREEFMSAYGSSSTRMRTRTTRDGGREHGTSNNALAARANLRAMAIRAISLRTRNPPV